MLYDEEMMLKAIALARKAFSIGEIPVGAIVADGSGKIIGEGYNRREIDGSPTAHAEILAIESAAASLGSWRLSDCTLYVTLEPCPMCAGAIINSRLKRVVYGAFDEKGGACASVLNLFELPFNHKPLVRSRVLEKECGQLLTEFFKAMRKTEDKMEINYSDKRNYSQQDVEMLFKSVNWLSANYPDRLKKALDNCETVFTAWDGDKLVGLVNAIDDGELTAYAHYLCVNPDYQGKGIGKALLNMLKDKYKDYLYIVLVAENEGLIKYYSQNGFTYMDDRFVIYLQHK